MRHTNAKRKKKLRFAGFGRDVEKDREKKRERAIG